MVAQTMRAVLLAMATVATRTGFRASRSARRGFDVLRFAPGAPHQRCYADDEELAKIFVAHLGDAAEPLFAAAGVLKRRQPKPGRELPP